MKLNQIIQGDIRVIGKTIPSQSVNCIVTSPPYWNLRDYDHSDQIGLEPDPEMYVQSIVNIFHELKRMLRDDGTLWLNLGDTFLANRTYQVSDSKSKNVGNHHGMKTSNIGLKPKNLIGIPWRVALALQNDGWYLRSDIIWHKPNCMPESVTDRPTRSHEYLFLLSKCASYYYDQDAIREPFQNKQVSNLANGLSDGHSACATFTRENSKRERPIFGQNHGTHRANRDNPNYSPLGRNKRSVWDVPVKPYKGAHSAVFPPDLIEPCILAGCPVNGVVLDPFFGSGTVGEVCIKNNRNWLGVELNSDYIKLANDRMNGIQLSMINL